MKFRGALVREQGVTFGIVVVNRHVLDDTGRANNVSRGFGHIFGAAPVVLMAQDHAGRAKFFGRSDIVRFLSRVPMRAIRWREYTI